MDFTQPVSREVLDMVAENLSAKGMPTEIVATAEEAKMKVLAKLNTQDEIMTMTSATLDAIGILPALVDGGYNLVRKQFGDAEITPRRKKELGSAPDFSLASAHAITQNGEIVIVSGTGSQLPAVAYGAGTEILIVGAQKIVENLDMAMRRIYDYVLPLESARINRVNNTTVGSSVNKILIISKEYAPGRIQVILVEEVLGF